VTPLGVRPWPEHEGNRDPLLRQRIAYNILFVPRLFLRNARTHSDRKLVGTFANRIPYSAVRLCLLSCRRPWLWPLRLSSNFPRMSLWHLQLLWRETAAAVRRQDGAPSCVSHCSCATWLQKDPSPSGLLSSAAGEDEHGHRQQRVNRSRRRTRPLATTC
jgi:hypothetical protein